VIGLGTAKNITMGRCEEKGQPAEKCDIQIEFRETQSKHERVGTGETRRNSVQAR